MDGAKLATLLEYKNNGEKVVAVDVLVEVSKMYMDSAGPENLESCCTAFVESLDKDKSVDALVAALTQPTTDVGRKLNELLVENGPKDSNKPVSTALSSLLDQDLEDDDDDEEEEAPKKNTVLEPMMRGLLKVKEGKLFWAGKWALSKEKFNEGDKSKFKFVYVGDAKIIDGKSISSPPSGKYSGYFMVKDANASGGLVKVEEKGNIIKFGEKKDNGNISVSGSGENAFGEFTLTGMYSPQGGKLSIIKTYKPKDKDFEADEEEDDEDDDIEDDDPEETAQELADLKADAAEDIEVHIKRVREQAEKDKQKKQKT
uniref:Uncharacterized protein n=1 Tax=Mucochytrium quahogii TaxID=96639 RepID=A0A7S2SI83_9STRA|mmetsp:Transcript_9630/g.15789  ORF Transcript_9630/g.15789 Transcript_9630/m.15789 type:complete len:315 (+) Transcript_9630:90-1034(+)|eukprot:CAMPEP_0203746408 /NCGR_PEP_ID=MMETSP0098-20131031/1864_1 /ASSEMBLY_ACC=CAM_ASM_000208 /TAXON_ID=96639 /ORGANISM=" , Strain NY0313808BC1" /LENGTH=314 /DNA_ID=CAMNT_0050634513 /DNA_START=150 /DNA_END=1094 /DNA_ORIENTATION=-